MAVLFVIIAQIMSFTISFLGISLFLSKTPADLEVLQAIYSILPGEHYLLKRGDVLDLIKVNAPDCYIDELVLMADRGTIYRDKTKFVNDLKSVVYNADEKTVHSFEYKRDEISVGKKKQNNAEDRHVFDNNTGWKVSPVFTHAISRIKTTNRSNKEKQVKRPQKLPEEESPNSATEDEPEEPSTQPENNALGAKPELPDAKDGHLDTEFTATSGTRTVEMKAFFVLTKAVIDELEQQYRDDLKGFCEKIGYDKSFDDATPYLYERLNVIVNRPVGDKARLIAEIKDHENSAGRDIVVESLAYSSLEKSGYWEFFGIIGVSFIFAFISMLLIGIPLFLFLKKGEERPRWNVICLCMATFCCGLLISGSSGFVITWVINNHSTYLQDLTTRRENEFVATIHMVNKEAFKQYACKRHAKDAIVEIEEQDDKILHYRQYLYWLVDVIEDYCDMVNQMHNQVNRGTKTQLQAFKSCKNKFDVSLDGEREAWSKSHTDVVADLEGRLEDELLEIQGGEDRKFPGYGTKAVRNLMDIGGYLHNSAKNLLADVKRDFSFEAERAGHNLTKVEASVNDSESDFLGVKSTEGFIVDQVNDFEQLDIFKQRVSLYKTKLIPELRRITIGLLNAWEEFRDDSKSKLLKETPFVEEEYRPDYDQQVERPIIQKYLSLIESVDSMEAKEKNYQAMVEKVEEIVGTLPHEVTVIQAGNIEPLHKLVRARISVLVPFLNIYHVPEKHFNNLERLPFESVVSEDAKKLTDNLKDGTSVSKENGVKKIQDAIVNLKDSIFISRENCVEEIQDEAGLLLSPADRIWFLGAVQKIGWFSWGIPKHIRPLLPLDFIEKFGDKNIHGHYPSKKEAYESICILYDGKIGQTHDILLNGLIQKESVNFNNDVIPLLLSCASDGSSVFLTVLARYCAMGITTATPMWEQLFGIPLIGSLLGFFSMGRVRQRYENQKNAEKRRLESEDKIERYRSEKLKKDEMKRFRQFRELKTEEWKKLVEDDTVSDFAQHGLLKELQMMGVIMPIDQYKELFDSHKKFSEFLNSAFNDLKKFRINTEKEFTETQLFLEKMKVLANVVGKSMHTIKTEMEKVNQARLAKYASDLQKDFADILVDESKARENIRQTVEQYRRNVIDVLSVAEKVRFSQFIRNGSPENRAAFEKLFDKIRAFKDDLSRMGP